MVIDILLAFLDLELVAEGKATHYDKHIMRQVVERRVEWGQLDLSQPHIGQVALADPEWVYLNRRVLLELPTGAVLGPFLVADVGKEKDQEHLKKIGFAVDLSYKWAERLDTLWMPLKGVKVWLLPKYKEE